MIRIAAQLLLLTAVIVQSNAADAQNINRTIFKEWPGWTITTYRTADTQAFLRCSAEKHYANGTALTIARTAPRYVLGFTSAAWPYEDRTTPPISVHIDSGEQVSATGRVRLLGSGPMLFMDLELGNPVISAIPDGKILHVHSEQTSIDFDLIGSKPVIAGLEECRKADSGLAAALASPDRPAEDKARDESSKPVQVIDFLGIESGSTVMDILAWDGWYSEVLAGAVGPEGKVIAQNADRYLNSPMYADMVAEIRVRVERLDNVELYFANADEIGVDGQVDAALVALRLHDAYIFAGEQRAIAFLGRIRKALKPGGTLGIIDYVGVAGKDNKELSRIERSTVQKLLADAGFEIETESDLLTMRYIQRLNKDVNKDNEIYTKAKQRCKQRQ